MVFPGGTVVKNPPANAEDSKRRCSITGLGRSSGGEHGNPLQYSCLENPMDRGAWWATVHGGVTKSQTRLKRLSKYSTGHVCVSCSCYNLGFILFIKQIVWIGSIFMEAWCEDLMPVDLVGSCGVTSLLLDFRSLIIFCDCRKPLLRQLIGFSRGGRTQSQKTLM